jgi:hypothetical protein
MDFSPSNGNSDFEFFSKIGADESMIDYTKMVILFAFQKEFDTVYKKCEIIRKKFEEKYGGHWIVGMFQNSLNDVSSCYDKYCICVIYNDYTFKIFKLN